MTVSAEIWASDPRRIMRRPRGQDLTKG